MAWGDLCFSLLPWPFFPWRHHLSAKTSWWWLGDGWETYEKNYLRYQLLFRLGNSVNLSSSCRKSLGTFAGSLNVTKTAPCSVISLLTRKQLMDFCISDFYFKKNSVYTMTVLSGLRSKVSVLFFFFFSSFFFFLMRSSEYSSYASTGHEKRTNLAEKKQWIQTAKCKGSDHWKEKKDVGNWNLTLLTNLA